MAAPVELVLVGAGLRGMMSYGPYAQAHPDEARFVAVVEPNEQRREAFATAHGIGTEHRYATVDDWLAGGQSAAAALVCTPDRDHVAPATAALEAGYDVLLEKPMAPTAQECIELVRTADSTGRRLEICHVLRYTPFFSRLHDIVSSGRLGEIVSVEHRENVGYWHMAHSYVRGAYGNSERASAMLLAKCCHDLDIMQWNLADPCVRVGSTGSLRHFRAESVGPDIPDRCTDGCPIEPDCAFSALRLYVGDSEPDPRDESERGWLALWPLDDEDSWSRTARASALRTSPLGRCVYHCDNDVVDHQVVTMELASGASAVLVMQGHSHRDSRTMRYDGTKATLRGDFPSLGSGSIEIHPHGRGQVERVPVDADADGHGGGDFGIMAAFVSSLRSGEALPTDARETLHSHLLGFAAEEARLRAAVVDVAEFERRTGLP